MEEGLTINQADGISISPGSVPLPEEPPSNPYAQRILIIDRDTDGIGPVKNRLVHAGFKVDQVSRGEDALAAMDREPPHLVMLDWDMPGVITMELVRHVRRRGSHDGARLIALSSFAGEQHVVSGLELGVDDYVIRPFSVPEMLARVRALLRSTRPNLNADSYLEFGVLRMDANDARVTALDRTVSLRSMEFRLLEFLIRHPERAFNRETLLNQVWGRDCPADARAVDVTVQRVRRALEPHGCEGYVQTIRGMGYRLSLNNVTAL